MKVKNLDLNDWFDSGKKNDFENELYLGLKECGFIVLKKHSVNTSVLDETYNLSEEFFKNKDEYKKQFISEKQKYQRGYVPFKTEKAKDAKAIDLKEFYQIGQDDNIFPNKNFEEMFIKLYKELELCSKYILQALAPSLNLNANYFDEMIEDGNHVLRLLHYPPIENEDLNTESIRAAAHEDINLITLLVAAKGKGLQLKDNNGNWLDIETEKGDIVVDIGDMLARITNRHLPSTTHRVVNGDQVNSSRYSMPFFCHPNKKAMLAVLDHFKDGNEQDDILADDFLTQRLKEIGIK